MEGIVSENLPILVIGYNRPDKLRTCLRALQAVPRLDVYVVIDGPKSNRDADLVAECQEVVGTFARLYGPVVYEFRIENRGCATGVPEAIDWFFDRVEFGVIVEDDIVVSPDFIAFAKSALDSYRDDGNVLMITGCNLAPHAIRADGLCFSRIPMIWGWATWKNRWVRYQSTAKAKPSAALLRDIYHFVDGRIAPFIYWASVILIRGRLGNTWDSHLVAVACQSRSLTLLPPRNLIMNMGNDGSGTHDPVDLGLRIESGPRIDMKTGGISTLTICPEYDRYLEVSIYGATFSAFWRRIGRIVRSRIWTR